MSDLNFLYRVPQQLARVWVNKLITNSHQWWIGCETLNQIRITKYTDSILAKGKNGPRSDSLWSKVFYEECLIAGVYIQVKVVLLILKENVNSETAFTFLCLMRFCFIGSTTIRI